MRPVRKVTATAKKLALDAPPPQPQHKYAQHVCGACGCICLAHLAMDTKSKDLLMRAEHAAVFEAWYR